MSDPPAKPANVPSDIPDDISISSTIDSQHDSDDEFNVERVLAEATDDNGGNWYLIQWTGYPMHQWTWEPEEHLHEPCLREWREIAQRQERGEEEAFDKSIHERAVAEAEEAKAARHRLRNIRRKKEGKPLNLYEGETEADYRSAESDADDDFNEILPPPRRHSTQAATSPTKKATASGPSTVDLTKEPAPRKRTSATGSASRDVSPTNSKQARKKPSSTAAVPSRPPPPARTTSAPLPGKPRATGNELQRKASSSVAKSPAALPGKARPATSSQRPGQDKGSSTALKARKSNGPSTSTAQRTSANVFAGGKKPRTRRKLDDVMGDKTKEPKAFVNYHMRGLAEVRSRERADIAPSNPSNLNLFELKTGEEYSTANKSSNPTMPTAPEGSAPASRPEETKSAMKKSRDLTMQPLGNEQPPPKKARSVRFTGDEPTADGPRLVTVRIIEDVDMVDEPAPVEDAPRAPEPGVASNVRPPTPPRVTEAPDVSLLPPKPKQNLSKVVIFGPPGSKQTKVVFESLPTGSDSWLAELAAIEVLEITHSCTSQAFFSQSHLLKQTVFACGNIAPPTPNDAAPLNSVADKLKLGSFGVAGMFQDFAVLVFPARCENWAATIPEAGNVVTPAPLKYLFFATGPGVGRLLKVPDSFAPDLKQKPGNTRSRVIRQLFSLEYDRLLSPTHRASPESNHAFFLAFPPTRQNIAYTIGAWLRDVNPKCRIFSSATAGDWRAFLEKGSGVVLIHERALPLIRLLPGLHGPLRVGERFFTFWKMQENLQHDRVPTLPAVSPPLELSRLFPHGTIVLLTPSFLVTRPARACQFLLWHRQRLSRPGSGVHLALSAGICDFLEEVGHEKARRRQLLLTASGSGQGELHADELGLSQADCCARFEAVQLVSDLINTKIARAEGTDTLIFSDDYINSSDEQSQVNWFGYWSQRNLDQFRKFLVVGSRAEDTKRATRIMGLPALEESSSAHTKELVPLVRGGHETEMLQIDSAVAFTNFLWHTQKGAPPFMKLYSYPVSYFDRSREMADHFGDIQSTFATVETWLNWTRPFDAKKSINTQICLFYTIDGEWEPARYAAQKFPPRRPWIGVYRVQHAARPPWTATELLIWDPRASEMCSPGVPPRPHHLLPAQRAMVEAVLAIGSKKNPAVEDVWFGGFDQSTMTGSTVIDRTLHMVEHMLRDPKFAVPSAENLLVARGFRKVKPAAARPRNDPSAVVAAQDVEIPAIDKPKSKNMIFHPPRNPDPQAVSSDCENHFFKQVAAAAAANDPGQRLSLNFPPTLEWYEQQKREGRGFEHIHVGSWDQIFKALQISDAGTTKQS